MKRLPSNFELSDDHDEPSAEVEELIAELTEQVKAFNPISRPKLTLVKG